MFSKPIRYLLAIILAITIALQTHPPAIATNPHSDCSAAATALRLQPELCDGTIQVHYKTIIGNGNDNENLRRLGVSLRRLGYLEEAQVALERSFQITPNTATRLSLANVFQAKFRRAASGIDPSGDLVANLELSEQTAGLAKQALSEYLAIYQADSNQLQAPLNWFNLWSRLNSTNELKQLQSQNLSSAQSLLPKITSQIEKLPIENRIEARLKLAEALNKVTLDKAFYSIAFDNASKALSESETTKNLRQYSKASGLVGQMLFDTDETDAGIDLLNKASSAAQSIRAYDLQYEWQWKLARIYVQQGDSKKAEKSYDDAIACIEKVRGDMLSLQSDLQYSFRDDIEPVYREYLNLLLSFSNPDLTKVIATNEQLQIGELENYLQCGSLGFKSLLTMSPEQSPDATLSLVKLTDHFGIVIRSKTGETHFRLVQREPVNTLIRQIKIYLQGDRFRESATSDEFKAISTGLYHQLITPVAEYLPKSGHLAFSIDSSLQSIPWGLLYDGQKYLVEQYGTSLSVGTELLPPKPLQGKPSALIAGATEFPKTSGYATLPGVANEINAIATTLRGKTLLNKDFNTENLIRLGSKAQILHLATHGQFSSLAKNTYILTWDGKYSLSNLEQFLKNRQNNPLELLVLSACKTATGDRRATLGLAGTAFQSGARSTVASLWAVQDDSQTILMQEFYSQLIQQRKSKAEALRLAQLKLLKSGKYSSPYFWSGTVLIGSGL
jgi:CHAT domain-containing protein